MTTKELKNMFLTPITPGVDVSYTTLATLTVCPLQKPKRMRTSYTETQIKEFEKVFVNNHYPSRELMEKLSDTLDIPVERMRTWFQNRRSRQKKTRQSETLKHLPTTAYHQTDTCPLDMEPSLDCLVGATMTVHGWGSERGMRHRSYAHTTHTPTTNQACMNCDSRTVYSTLYHHPVMTPVEVTTPSRGQLDYDSPRLSNRGSHFGDLPCYVKQGYMQLASTSIDTGYTFQQPISCPHLPHLSMDMPPHIQGNINFSPSFAAPLSGQQTGAGYTIDNSQSANNIHVYPNAINRNTYGADNDAMYSVGANNNTSFSGFPDNNGNTMYNLLLNVGQLQLSSYRMQVSTNTTLCEQQTYNGDLDPDVDRQLGSRCQSVDPGEDSLFFCPMESQHVVHTACRTPPPQSTGTLGSHASVYPWQFNPRRDFRSWNINRLLLGSQPTPVDSLQALPTDGNQNRLRNEMPNSRLNLGFRQHFRPGREANPAFTRAPFNYVSHAARSTDDDSWSTRTSQDSDTESLESFGSGSCIRQMDMTASLLSEIGPYSPMSPDSFRGDTPHPDL